MNHSGTDFGASAWQANRSASVLPEKSSPRVYAKVTRAALLGAMPARIIPRPLGTVSDSCVKQSKAEPAAGEGQL